MIDRLSKKPERLKLKKNGSYFEGHHIIPKYKGGTGNSNRPKNNPNIVLLTAREHFIAHWLLARIYPNNAKIIYAFWMMCNTKNKNQPQRFTPSSRQYQEAKQIFSITHSVKQPEGTGYKKSIALKNRPKPEGFGSNIGNFHKGRKRSIETKYKMSIAKQGKPSNAVKYIYQYDLQGNFIKKWDSAIDAESVLKINSKDINTNCRGITKKSHGYIWKYYTSKIAEVIDREEDLEGAE
jgi:hypothetical protein